MSLNRVLHYRFRLVCCCAGAIAVFFSLAANVLAQEAIGATDPAATSAPSPQSGVEMASSSPTLNPAVDSNLNPTTDLRNEVTAEPRRFQYGVKVTMRGVYDDNINLSQTARVSDYYFTIEPVLTLGLGDILGHEDNYIRLDYAPSLFLFADNSENLFSSQMFSGNLFVNYRYSEKIVIGVGSTGGVDFVDNPNPDQTFEQANVRASYQATGKIAFNFSGGVEFRQFENNSRSEYISPVFELSATYQPFDGTSVTLAGSRRTFNSGVLAGQDFAGTTITASLRQRLLQRFYVGVSGGYQNSDYFSTVSGVAANRQDNYYFIEPTLDFSITRFWTVGGYYLHRRNDSSFQSFSFDDNQVGIRTGLTF